MNKDIISTLNDSFGNSTFASPPKLTESKTISFSNSKYLHRSSGKNPAKSPRIALLGCGYWGKNLARNFYNLEALKLVCLLKLRKAPKLRKSSEA